MAVTRCSFVFEKVVLRDRIELSTPGFSATRTDARRRPGRSTIVFMRTAKGRLASTVYHQCPRTKVSAKVSFSGPHSFAGRPLEDDCPEWIIVSGDITLVCASVPSREAQPPASAFSADQSLTGPR